MSSQQNFQELLFPHQMYRMLVFAATSKRPTVRFRTLVVAQCVRYTSTAAQQFLLFQIFLVAFSLFISHSLTPVLLVLVKWEAISQERCTSKYE
jgi:hypothetical protein